MQTASSPVPLFITKREDYARTFLNMFRDSFTAAEESGVTKFALSLKGFDEFICLADFCSFDTPPSRHDDTWHKFVAERNMVRSELNNASSLGHHGHPPYRIDYESGEYIVRLLNDMVMVTAQQMAEALISLAESKDKELKRMNAYLLEHMESLPPALHARVAIQDRAFHRAVSNATSVLNGYIEDTRELFDDIVTHTNDIKQLESD